MNKKFLAITFLFIFCNIDLFCWVYPEHREITLIAIEKLKPQYKAILDNLWAEARKGYEFRLTESVTDPQQSINPVFLDFASWPAIAGDHSCSSDNMLHNILETEWILKVADVSAKLKLDLEAAETRDERINSLRNSDLSLQDADPEYVTRAGSNNAHFLIALKEINISIESYINSCVEEGVEINAIGVYMWYHYSAMLKATKLSATNLSSSERSILILSALADEAFALHFLEDVFAAGHVAGTWGDASQRKGTHDYYNEKGLMTSTWEGDQVILTGDAWMKEEDAERAAVVIRLSIEQLLEAAEGNKDYFFYSNIEVSRTPDTFNVCQQNFMPEYNFNPVFVSLVTTTLLKTPVPGLATGLGELPRFRAEIGLFVGFSPALRGSVISGGFAPGQESIGLTGGIEAAARFGFGLEGVLNESGDGLVFLEFGWAQSGASTNGVVDEPGLEQFGNLLAAIPGRSSLSARIRLPFYLIPGDLLIAGPLLLIFDPDALTKMGVTAVNGGLIPWQLGIATSFGRFQFVLGREVAVYLSGRTKGRDAIFVLVNDDVVIMSYRSTQIEFPVLEYRPFRSFATDQSSSLLFQLYAGIDFPHNEDLLVTLNENVMKPKFNKIWYVGARLIFDWRHYF